MNRISLYLMVAGVTPFVALSVAVALQLFADAGAMVEWLLVYAAVIISFLGGVHWGLAVTQHGRNRKIANLLLVGGIVPPLIAWGSLYYGNMHVQLLVLTLLYTFVWAVDSLLYSRDVIPQWFFDLRSIITPIVVVSLYVAYFAVA